jgi:hypothetical protein
MAFKRFAAIHMSSSAVLLADAREVASWTGRTVDGDWFRFPLDGVRGRIATWRGHQGILAELATVTVNIVEVHRDGETLLLAAIDWTHDTRYEPAALAKLPATTKTPLGRLVLPSRRLAILESREPGTFVPADLEHQKVQRGTVDGVLIVPRDSDACEVTHEIVDLGERLGERVRVAPV